MSKFRKLLQSQPESQSVSSEQLPSSGTSGSASAGMAPPVQISPRSGGQGSGSKAVPKKVSAQAYKIPDPQTGTVSPPQQNTHPPSLSTREDLDYVKITAYIRKATQMQVLQLLQAQGEMELSELIDFLLKQWIAETHS